jgi:glycosidase
METQLMMISMALPLNMILCKKRISLLSTYTSPRHLVPKTWRTDRLSSRQTQLRHGGDLQGLVDSLDYLQGMGIKGIYIAGSPFINQPWVSDSYSPLDFTLLDKHFGDIQMWRTAVTGIHDRGMYGMIIFQ